MGNNNSSKQRDQSTPIPYSQTNVYNNNANPPPRSLSNNQSNNQYTNNMNYNNNRPQPPYGQQIPPNNYPANYSTQPNYNNYNNYQVYNPSMPPNQYYQNPEAQHHDFSDDKYGKSTRPLDFQMNQQKFKKIQRQQPSKHTKFQRLGLPMCFFPQMICPLILNTPLVINHELVSETQQHNHDHNIEFNHELEHNDFKMTKSFSSVHSLNLDEFILPKSGHQLDSLKYENVRENRFDPNTTHHHCSSKKQKNDEFKTLVSHHSLEEVQLLTKIDFNQSLQMFRKSISNLKQPLKEDKYQIYFQQNEGQHGKKFYYNSGFSEVIKEKGNNQEKSPDFIPQELMMNGSQVPTPKRGKNNNIMEELKRRLNNNSNFQPGTNSKMLEEREQSEVDGPNSFNNYSNFPKGANLRNININEPKILEQSQSFKESDFIKNSGSNSRVKEIFTPVERFEDQGDLKQQYQNNPVNPPPQVANSTQIPSQNIIVIKPGDKKPTQNVNQNFQQNIKRVEDSRELNLSNISEFSQTSSQSKKNQNILHNDANKKYLPMTPQLNTTSPSESILKGPNLENQNEQYGQLFHELQLNQNQDYSEIRNTEEPIQLQINIDKFQKQNDTNQPPKLIQNSRFIPMTEQSKVSNVQPQQHLFHHLIDDNLDYSQARIKRDYTPNNLKNNSYIRREQQNFLQKYDNKRKVAINTNCVYIQPYINYSPLPYPSVKPKDDQSHLNSFPINTDSRINREVNFTSGVHPDDINNYKLADSRSYTPKYQQPIFSNNNNPQIIVKKNDQLGNSRGLEFY